MTRRLLIVLVAGVVASCSSGGGETTVDVPATANSSTPEPDEADDIAAVTTLDAGVATTESQVDRPSDVTENVESDVTENVESDVTENVESDVTSTTQERSLVITGPASVDVSVEREPAEEAPCADVPRGTRRFELDAGGAVRDVRIEVPATLSSEPAPVVLNWHGLGSDGESQAAYSGYEQLASQEGFVVVHATGASGGNSPGTSWEFDGFDDPDRDDLAFVDALIDAVVADWCGDPARIYSTGMSNGGFFTASLVCHRADRIAAAVAVGGLAHPDGCEPARPVPFLAYHGTDDGIVPFDGNGRSPLDGIVSDEFFTNAIPAEFAQFAAVNGCSPEPIRTEETPEATRYDYVDCAGGVPMTFYELPGSGHIWPNSPTASTSAGTDFHTSDVDATVDGWEFLRQHALD